MGYAKNEDALKSVGKRIRFLRKEAGYSQQEFADLCDMELSTVNRVELGKSNTTVSLIFKMAEVLKLKPSTLLEIEK